MNEKQNIDTLNIKNIDTYFDVFDKACMLLYDKTGINYLDAILRVFNDIYTCEVDERKLEANDVKKLKSYEDKITSLYFLNEEIRHSLLLLVIKAFKHVGRSLDLISPDYIGYIVTFIIKALFNKEVEKEHTDKISILDINLGTSNLINLISNNLDFDSELIGIEEDSTMCNLAYAFSDLQGNEINVYNNSCLDYMTLSANVIIGDLDCKMVKDKDGNDKYLPYEAILKYQVTNVSRSFMIFVIDNDFFAQSGIEEFKANFKGTMLALLVLPEELFKAKGKSILVLSPKKYKEVDTIIVNVPKQSEEEKFRLALSNLQKGLKKY